MRFNPGDTSLVCPFCGHRQDISPGAARAPARSGRGGPEGDELLLRDPATGRALQWDGGHKSQGITEIPLEKGLRLDASSDLAETIRTLSCPNCGAKIDQGSARHSTACPFCATPVVTDTGATRQIKPQAVMPFVVTEDQARGALDDWLGGLWFAPSGLTAYARRARRMSGVYSPFWTFDADTQSEYRGQRGDYYYVTVYVTQTVNGQTRRVPQQQRRVRWSNVSGRVARSFDDVLVLAASSLPRRFTDALTPWDLAHLREYDPRFLSGFEAEGYTIALADGHQIARQEMAGVISMDVRRDIGGDQQRITALNTRHSNETFKHILLPIWTAAYKYNGKSYRFVVNGQSGRVQGERPYSIWKIALAVIAAMLVLGAIMLASGGGGTIRIGDAVQPAPAAIAASAPDSIPIGDPLT